jgi:hypothetical protein
MCAHAPMHAYDSIIKTCVRIIMMTHLYIYIYTYIQCHHNYAYTCFDYAIIRMHWCMCTHVHTTHTMDFMPQLTQSCLEAWYGGAACSCPSLRWPLYLRRPFRHLIPLHHPHFSALPPKPWLAAAYLPGFDHLQHWPLLVPRSPWHPHFRPGGPIRPQRCV